MISLILGPKHWSFISMVKCRNKKPRTKRNQKIGRLQILPDICRNKSIILSNPETQVPNHSIGYRNWNPTDTLIWDPLFTTALQHDKKAISWMWCQHLGTSILSQPSWSSSLRCLKHLSTAEANISNGTEISFKPSTVRFWCGDVWIIIPKDGGKNNETPELFWVDN